MEEVRSAKHVMVDLETLGTSFDAAIVAIGAVAFDPRENTVNVEEGLSRTFYKIVDIENSVKYGSVTGETIKWWMQQSEQARKDTFNAGMPLHKVLYEFAEFCKLSWGAQDVWGNGTLFDNAILIHAYSRCNIPLPWSFRADRCYRTVLNLLPKEKRPEVVRYGTFHNALHDAITQAQHLQKIYKLLGLSY